MLKDHSKYITCGTFCGDILKNVFTAFVYTKKANGVQTVLPLTKINFILKLVFLKKTKSWFWDILERVFMLEFL